MSTAWPDRVLSFWFGELAPKAWFEKSDAVDARIRQEFLGTYEHLAGSVDGSALLASPETVLAALIVLDQFPRNMFRATPRAFEGDAKALALAHAAVDHRLDHQVEQTRRLFFYLPFEHSEALADQDRSVELFAKLGDPDYLRYAEAHRGIIRRFGRFPHRNPILGRQSTADEIAFLATPGSSF